MCVSEMCLWFETQMQTRTLIYFPFFSLSILMESDLVNFTKMLSMLGPCSSVMRYTDIQVILRSSMIGREELDATKFKQMTGVPTLASPIRIL